MCIAKKIDAFFRNGKKKKKKRGGGEHTNSRF